MGAGGSTEEATELERQRRSGDMTKAGVWRVSHFHRLVMFYKKEWTHEVSGRVHHNRKFQRLAWNLEKLDLRDNVLKYFANPSAKRLKALREIDLSQNRFKRFPKDAFAPPNIEIVRICENKIRNVRLPPPSLLTTLVELHLDNNRIMELPDAFIDFESLEVLSLSSNGFVDMPDVILELDTLKQLLMEQNAMWSASLCCPARSCALPGSRLTDERARVQVPAADVQPAGEAGGAGAQREQLRDDAARAVRHGQPGRPAAGS